MSDDDLKKLPAEHTAQVQRGFGAYAERLEKKIEIVADGVLRANEHLNRLEDQAEDVSESLSRIEAKVDHVDVKVDKLTARVTDLETLRR